MFVPPDEPGGRLPADGQEPCGARPAAAVGPLFPDRAGRPAGALRPARGSTATVTAARSSSRTHATRSARGRLSSRSPCARRVMETRRGRFFGAGRGVAHPYLVERGEPDAVRICDDRPIAAILDHLEVPAHGEHTVVVVLGQADDREQAEAVIGRYQDVDAALASLEETRRWWLGLMDTVRVQTSNPEFDGYLDWLKYQALAERIWARRGFYQASGAYGFRDQLQDSVNLIWMDPALARRQILLHASQQFLEGDVVHWFHRLQDGRTGFVGRTHASDNLLWLVWGVVEYVARDRRRFAAGRADALPGVGAAVRAPARRESRGWGSTPCGRRGKIPSTGTA